MIPAGRWSQRQYGSQSVINGVNQSPRQPTRTIHQPCAIYQVQSQRHCNGVGRQTGDRGVEQDIADETSPIEILRQRHDMGLPDVDIQNIVRRHDHTRPTFVEIDPVHPAALYHGADRSIHSPATEASPGVGLSGAASSASATS